MWDLFGQPGGRGRSEGGEGDRDHPFELDEASVPVEADEATAPYIEALSGVVDPELGINLVDLGLVYALEVDDEVVRAAITATTPACPMQAVLVEDAEEALRGVDDGDRRVEVYLVWEPSWRPEWMSDAARERLGGGFGPVGGEPNR